MASPTSDAPVHKRRRAAQIPEDEWQAYQKTILNFYIKEGLTLLELMQRMETEWDFHATVKQYKRRLSIWGFLKNVKSHEIRELVQDDADGMCTPSGIKVTEAKKKRHLRKMMMASRLASEQNQVRASVSLADDKAHCSDAAAEDSQPNSDAMSDTSTIMSDQHRPITPDTSSKAPPVRQLPTPPQNPTTDCTPPPLELLYDIGPWSLEDSTLSEVRNHASHAVVIIMLTITLASQYRTAFTREVEHFKVDHLTSSRSITIGNCCGHRYSSC